MQSRADQASPLDPTTSRILGAYFGVYRALGWGFLENVYQQAMVVGLSDMGASVHREVTLPVYYRGQLVGEYRADLIVDDRVIVEVKAVETLSSTHRAQLLNYLKATSMEVGLLLNFGPRPTYERLVFSNERKEPQPLRF